jgi:hypothetical protein
MARFDHSARTGTKETMQGPDERKAIAVDASRRAEDSPASSIHFSSPLKFGLPLPVTAGCLAVGFCIAVLVGVARGRFDSVALHADDNPSLTRDDIRQLLTIQAVFASPMSLSFWNILMSIATAAFGCTVAYFGSKRNARPLLTLVFANVVMLIGVVVPPLILDFALVVGILPRAVFGPITSFVASSLFILTQCLLYVGRGDPQTVPPSSTFGTLPFRPLPIGLHRGKSISVLYGEEDTFPFERAMCKPVDVAEGVIVAISYLKEIDDIVFWRCSGESDKTVLLLIEREVSRGKLLWCLLSVTQPGSGNDISIRLQRLTPRNLDKYDYTLLRYLAFPAVIFLNVMGSEDNEDPPPSFGVIVWTIILCFLALVLGIVARWEQSKDPMFFVLPGLIAAFGAAIFAIVYVIEPKRLNKKMERASTEFLHIVQGAIRDTVMALRSV